ncbi:unnamed protein product [Fusarium graminearum]|nr:unnamed protein product [Fusarium graminearum]
MKTLQGVGSHAQIQQQCKTQQQQAGSGSVVFGLWKPKDSDHGLDRLNRAREKMDELVLGNYRRVAEPRGAIEDDNGHRSRRQRAGTHVASQTRELMASHHSIPNKQQLLPPTGRNQEQRKQAKDIINIPIVIVV